MPLQLAGCSGQEQSQVPREVASPAGVLGLAQCCMACTQLQSWCIGRIEIRMHEDLMVDHAGDGVGRRQGKGDLDKAVLLLRCSEGA